MTNLAYMVREDWAQRGTAMASNSARIREWLGESPILYAVTDTKKFSNSERNADFEAYGYLQAQNTKHHVVNIADLTRLIQQEGAPNISVVVLHPFEPRDCEILREVFDAAVLQRIFILVWSPHDVIRTWLDAHCATNLQTGASHPSIEPLQLAAAQLLVDRQYNGLSTGRGKDAAVQLIRAFTTEGRLFDEADWLCAFFAAGGNFAESESLKKLIREMKKGVNHRVKPAFRPEILDILRKQIATPGI